MDRVQVGIHLMPDDQSLTLCEQMAALADGLLDSPWRNNLAMFVGNIQLGAYVLGYRLGLS